MPFSHALSIPLSLYFCKLLTLFAFAAFYSQILTKVERERSLTGPESCQRTCFKLNKPKCSDPVGPSPFPLSMPLTVPCTNNTSIVPFLPSGKRCPHPAREHGGGASSEQSAAAAAEQCCPPRRQQTAVGPGQHKSRPCCRRRCHLYGPCRNNRFGRFFACAAASCTRFPNPFR